MSDPDHTRCRLHTPDLLAEITGPRGLVEEVYRDITEDLARLDEPHGEPAERARRHPLWAYLGTTHLNKVYAVESSALTTSPLGRFVDSDRVRRLYAHERRALAFAGLDHDTHTLWAEFTPQGRALLHDTLKPR